MSRLVVGLGNPGTEYAETRHNVGFRVLDRLAAQREALFRGPSRLEGWTGPRGFDWARVDARDERGHGAFLLKPGTYMNRSGDIVAPVARWLEARGELAIERSEATDGADEAPSEESGSVDAGPANSGPAELGYPSLLVVYDDLDLDVARLRLRPHGGHGGQNGMRSIIDRLGSRMFPRLRVGIGRPATDAARHVLSTFAPSEQEEIEVSIAEAVDSIEAWLDGEDFAQVMTRFHSRWN